MKQIHLKNTVIGEGKPKICIPIVANNMDEVVSQAEKIAELPVDIIELRGDYFDDYLESGYVIQAIRTVRKIGNVPVLYTFRT
ncbi:MAG: type I 3-dehydroquinate dehydratase, partial [Lachnospiraceae bacterium]|nr:type I 3-dehydroquinate dehydratase [Lachnospiraceae bacterium]